MLLNRRYGPPLKEEFEEIREFLKSLKERIKQLRRYDGDIDEEDDDYYIAEGL